MVNVYSYNELIEPYDDIPNIEIVDPENSELVYCIGLKHTKGDRSDPQNWEIDHINLWADALGDDACTEVSEDNFTTMLQRHGMSVRSVLHACFTLAFSEMD